MTAVHVLVINNSGDDLEQGNMFSQLHFGPHGRLWAPNEWTCNVTCSGSNYLVNIVQTIAPCSSQGHTHEPSMEHA